MIAHSFSTLPAFLAYLAIALLILALFVRIYVSFTPYREIALIREGNLAAAVSLSGTLIGFALPVADVIRNSRDLVDLAVWSAIACLVQLVAYLAARLTLPHLAQDIPEGKVAPALFLAALSVGVGLVNAACMQS
jgi:putative membrane protein